MRSALAHAAFALACGVCAPAGAAVLYKSVGPNGVIQFSDQPPEKGRIVQQLQIGDGSSPPTPLVAQAPVTQEKLLDMDVAVQRANAQVDLAERGLATARRPVWTEPNPGNLTAPRMTRSDIERIEFYKRNVIVARQMLLEVLNQKRRAAVRDEVMASARAPIYGYPTVRR